MSVVSLASIMSELSSGLSKPSCDAAAVLPQLVSLITTLKVLTAASRKKCATENSSRILFGSGNGHAIRVD